MTKRRLVQCPVCGVKVREDRLEKHKLKHGADVQQRRRAHNRGRSEDQDGVMIRTKVMKELAPGKFLALGFGDVAASNLDGVIVSSFLKPVWVEGSAIKAIARSVGEDYLSMHWPVDRKPGSAHVIDVSAQPGVQFDKLFIVFMNYAASRYRHPNFPDQNAWLSMGLRNLQALLEREGVKRVDITALGTQYGGLGHKAAFEMLSEWTVNLFSRSPEMDLIRITTTNLDAFIDFFEILYKMPAWNLSPSIGEDFIGTVTRVDFGEDLNLIGSLLERGGYDLAISACRTTIEKKVKEVYSLYGWVYPGGLFNAVEKLRSKGVLPVQIGAYFDVVRKLGNFTVHADVTFTPTRRDAEIVFSLTLRIIEWQPDGKSA